MAIAKDNNMETFKLQNKISYLVQTQFNGGWIDVYCGNKLLFSKPFKDLDQLELIKRSIESVVVASLITKDIYAGL